MTRRDWVSVPIGFQRRGPRELPCREAGGLGPERDLRDLGRRAVRVSGPVKRDPHRCAARRDRRRAQDEATPGPTTLSLGIRWVAHETGRQWKVAVTLWGLSHTCWYSTWRADTGGLTSRLSW